MRKKQKRRKLDQFLRGYRKDPDVALEEMTRLSNRIWKLFIGVLLTGVFVYLVWPTGDWRLAAGIGTLIFIINGLGWFTLFKLESGLFDRPANFNQFIIVVLATVAISKLVFVLDWSVFLVPLPLLAMIMGMTHGPAVTLITVIGVGFYLSLLSPRLWGLDATGVTEAVVNHFSADPEGFENINLLIYFARLRLDMVLGLSLVLGGVVATLGVQHIRQQSKPALVGLLAGLVQAGVVMAFRIVEPDFSAAELKGFAKIFEFLENPGWAFISGLAAGGLLTIVLPLIERFFGVITDRRLLALSDPNNDLLKTLRNRAPGTYQHTLGVAQLASSAAEAIGADPLLTQVGAYYHDIGKIFKPEYFVENMGEDKSIHSRLRPSMSKLIIISHVKEGMELAQEEKLPPPIIDMIPMHHGTTVVEYFFHKALEMSAHASTESETTYRYPGPRPRFKEAGILMLADAVEATAKTIEDPNPTRFQGMVSEFIRKRLHDGQLDECPLTIRDLRQIEDSFVRTLTTMYHSRIRYPGGSPGEDSAKAAAEANGDKNGDKNGNGEKNGVGENTARTGEKNGVQQGAAAVPKSV